MSFVIAAVVLVGLLCALDLLLTVGVIKRLREHTELLSGRGGGQVSLGPGDEVGKFSVTTVEGEPVHDDMINSETVVGFFSPTCGPCKEMLPKFVEYARGAPAGREQVLAVVAADGQQDAEAVAPMLSTLAPVARVLTGRDADAVAGACKVRAFPALLRINRSTRGRLLVMANQVDLDRPAVASR
ncbi:TlpA family protein [Longimycelium tulufanense]|uniref:TlpA family protein n=1 Tax=Longimycelium tulufanense TaxID=907463 RepID=A0A8J3CAR6_9PSEU|nr:thioredoxin domain-containing protein [Longimycelium tulufanense]GGM40184.1 TlpA family protein [Longimycelium tulufanense]